MELVLSLTGSPAPVPAQEQPPADVTLTGTPAPAQEQPPADVTLTGTPASAPAQEQPPADETRDFIFQQFLVLPSPPPPSGKPFFVRLWELFMYICVVVINLVNLFFDENKLRGKSVVNRIVRAFYATLSSQLTRLNSP